jgi:hypothetical protein
MKISRRLRLGFACTVALASGLVSCGKSASLKPNKKPLGVPADALWVGGADGGAYVRCTVDSSHNVNPCSVWNDYTGALIESGNYQLRKEGRAAKESELRVSFPDFGGLIYLDGGLVLKRQ